MIAGDEVREQLEDSLSRLAGVATLLLEFWGDAQRSAELGGRPAKLLTAAVGPAVQREVRLTLAGWLCTGGLTHTFCASTACC